jgi:hypothetical protein
VQRTGTREELQEHLFRMHLEVKTLIQMQNLL